MTTFPYRLLPDLRRELLRLHKVLLEWERASYERRHGRLAPGDLLRVVMGDPHFAWLRPVSELIVHIDEAIEAEASDVAFDAVSVVGPIVSRARAFVALDGHHAPRYREALQADPDAVLAHRAVKVVLDTVAPGDRGPLH
jgi:hypothetical protein